MGPGWKQPAEFSIGLELSRAGQQKVGRMGLEDLPWATLIGCEVGNGLLP